MAKRRRTDLDAIPELREIERESGKFGGGPVATRLVWEASLDGGADEEVGDAVEWGEWYGLMRDVELPSGYRVSAILFTNSAGFISAKFFETAAAAEREWRRLVREVERDMRRAGYYED